MTEVEKTFLKKSTLRFFDPVDWKFEKVFDPKIWVYFKIIPNTIRKKNLDDLSRDRTDERKRYWTKTFVNWALRTIPPAQCFAGSDSEACGLCNRFMTHLDEYRHTCHPHCPVKKETGLDSCKGTPYGELDDIGGNSETQAMVLLREISFLCRLCREDFAKSYRHR